METNRNALLTSIAALLSKGSTDELRAFHVIASKVMGQGRETYGPTHLANDPRDFMHEGGQEGVDAVWYFALEIVKRALFPRRSSISLVREFYERFGQVVNGEPHVDDDGLNTLRIALLEEELTELSIALDARDPVATLDALTDLQYVLDGAYLSLGFASYKDAALAEVHRSNMSKLSADGKPVLREDGKILKGPHYSPPDLASVLSSATSSASPNELTHAEGVAPFSSPSLGALPPSPSSSANSHGDTFLPPPDDRSTAVPHAVSGGGSFLNRLGRACTDCGAGDGEEHIPGCIWTEVVR